MTDKLIVLLGDPALPSWALIDNALISNLLYLLMLFKVISVLITAGETTTTTKKPRLDSYSNSNLFALFFLF